MNTQQYKGEVIQHQKDSSCFDPMLTSCKDQPIITKTRKCCWVSKKNLIIVSRKTENNEPRNNSPIFSMCEANKSIEIFMNSNQLAKKT